MEEEEKFDYTAKILLLGDSSVGKTCFIKRYIDNTFQDAYLSTIGFDFKLKFVTLDDGTVVKVQLWDTAGQERFRTIAKSYYKGAHGIILIYDVTSKKTYLSIKTWINQIKEQASNKISIILVANKIDSEDPREVTTEQGENLAKNYGLSIYEASAKEGINITESIKALLEDINKNISTMTNPNNISLDKDKDENPKKCC